MTPGSAHTFRTDLVPSQQRLTYWNDVAVTTFGNIAVDAASSAFSGRLERKRLDELTVARVWSTPACVHGGASGVRAVDGWFLLLNERGNSHFVQKGRETSLGPGELTVLAADADYRIRFSQPNDVIVLHLPRGGPVRNIDLESRIARRHETAEIQLLSAFLRRLASVDPREHLGTVQFTSLAAEILTLTWPTPTREAARRRKSVRYWRERAIEIIERRLAEPDLNAESISRDLGISTRYLHLAFAATPNSVSEHILARRLERAARQLRANPTASVTDIASSVGFADLSYFCRTFRCHFGATATRYRQSS